MSNSQRYVIPKKHFQNEIKRLQAKLNESANELTRVNETCADWDKRYWSQYELLKPIRDNNLFLALYEAFRLWRGERRG